MEHSTLRVRAALGSAIPEGMIGTLHLDWYDPNNVLATEMEKAYILVEEITNEKFSEWKFISHPSVAFERNINWEYVHLNYTNINCGRDISTISLNQFGTLEII